MGSSTSANAVIAKMRAKYGKRLSQKDYENLLACKSVAEVVVYLKNNTYYDTVLKAVNDREAHRGRLELILRQKLFDDFYSLCRYLKGTGEYFADYIIQKDEIEQIIHFLTLLSYDSPQEYFFKMPVYFKDHSSVDLPALSRARDVDSFFAVLTGTPYEKTASRFRPRRNDSSVDIPELENALYRACYDNLYNNINTKTSNGEKKALLEMFDSIIDIMNFVRILRLKKYYKESAEVARRHIFPHGSLSPQVITKLCEAKNSSEIFDAVKDTKLGKSIGKMNYVYAGQIQEIGIYNITKRNIHFSTYPIVAMLSYVFVMQQEYSNIVSIIEGVRYGVDPEQLRAIVII